MMKKRFTAETLEFISYLSMPSVHPDNRKTAFVKTNAERDTGLFIPHIYEIDHLTKKVVEAVPALAQEKHPLYSPDGTILAYLSNQSGEFQIYLKSESDTQGKQITTLRHGVTSYSWSKDSKKLIFEAPVFKADQERQIEFLEINEQEKTDYLEEKEWAPIEIEEIDYKNDDCYGVRDKSIQQIGIVMIDGTNQHLITKGEMQCSFPVMNADESKVAFYGKPYKAAYASTPELFVCEITGRNLKQVSKERAMFLNPSQQPLFSADDKFLYTNAYIPYEGSECVESIYQVEIATGNAELIFDEKDESVTFGINGTPISRTVYGEESPCFIHDEEEKYLYFKNSWYGFENLYRMKLDGSKKIEPVLEGRINVHSFCVPRKGKIMFIGGDFTTIAELYSLDLKTKQLMKMTESNEWLNDYELAQTEEVWVETKDKQTKLQIFIVHPVEENVTDNGVRKGYPCVLDVRGGPECSYVSDFWHEFQVLAGAGIACVYTNPRGSMGYGAQFSKNDYAYGQEAVDDLLLAVETAVDKGVADPDHIGITGGSYGGYMSVKFVGTTNRFQAAVVQRALVNKATSYGTGDIGFISRRVADVSKVKMLDVLIERARTSMIRYVDHMKTPMLLLHGYLDFRCTFEQSEQLFIAMKERNPEVPVKLVMFPDENHGITRIGKLHNQINHLKELTDWFVKYLREETRQNG